MRTAQLNNPVLFYGGALGGIMIWWQLLEKFPSSRWTRNMADHGLLIYESQTLSLALLAGILEHGFQVALTALGKNGVIPVVLAVILLLFTWQVVIPLQRWFPILRGAKKRRKEK